MLAVSQPFSANYSATSYPQTTSYYLHYLTRQDRFDRETCQIRHGSYCRRPTEMVSVIPTRRGGRVLWIAPQVATLYRILIPAGQAQLPRYVNSFLNIK